jgi:hypothetical protein
MSFIRLFRAGACALLTLALSSTIVVAQGNSHGHNKHDRDDDDRAYDDHDHGHGHGHGHGHHRYADRDRDIRDWYRAHYDHLPPGLAKRDRLPPGTSAAIGREWNVASRPAKEGAAVSARAGGNASASTFKLRTRRYRGQPRDVQPRHPSNW